MSAIIIKSFWADESGATAMEYALLGTLVAVAIAGTFTALGDSLTNLFNNGATDVITNQTATLSAN